MEGDPRLEKTDAIIEHRDIPNYANSVRSTAPLLESTSPSPAIRPTAERNGSRVIPSSSKRRIHTWRSPLLMVVFYILGLSLSVAHCVFYPKLKGRIVGDSGQQEEKIRWGTAFAFLAQISLGAGVWSAYTQWVWRTLKKKEMRLATINSAFGVETSVLSLLNIDLWKKLRVGSVMAFFAWSLLLPPFFTPATLFIYESTNVVEKTEAMPYPSISNASEAHRFSYSPPTHRGTTQYLNDVYRTFTNPRTVLSILASATSSLGEILPLDLPYNNSAYSIEFFAPIVRCAVANQTEKERMDEFLREETTTVRNAMVETDNVYYSFVPTYNSTGNLTAIWHPRRQIKSNPINELWMTFLRPTFDGQGKRIKPRQYQICRPHSASYSLEISQHHGLQEVSGSYEVGDAISFPNDDPEKPSNMTQHAYTAFMWVICDQLVGKFAWYNKTDTASDEQVADQFGVIDSPIQRTGLLGSLDLDAYFELDEEKGLYKGQNMSKALELSDQRLKDKAMARNRTLDVLIEELSFNTTVSLMHNRLLTDPFNTTIKLRNDVNRYDYKTYGLFIPYALANLFALLCIALGLVSFIRDGAMPGKKVQDFVSAARSPELHNHPRLGARTTSLNAVIGEDGAYEMRVARDGVQEGEASSAESWRSVRYSGEDGWSGDVEGRGVSESV